MTTFNPYGINPYGIDAYGGGLVATSSVIGSLTAVELSDIIASDCSVLIQANIPAHATLSTSSSSSLLTAGANRGQIRITG